MFGQPNVVHIENDGSPNGPKHLLLCAPNVADSYISQMVEVVLVLLCKQIRTIVFAKTRKCCELAFCQLSKCVQEKYKDKIMSYRAGYSISERRKIESDLFNGNLLVVISTNALELGIDIGNLQAVVHLGFPNSIASYRQQLGRCGRRDAESYSIMIPDVSCPMDNAIVQDPHILFSAKSFGVNVDYSDPQVVREQIICAAGDLPLGKNDEQFFGEYYDGIHEYLVHDIARQTYIPPASMLQPSQRFSIRSKRSENIRVIHVLEYREIGYVEFDRLAYTLYPGAIYQFQATSFVVNSLKLDQLVAFVYPAPVEYLTYPRAETTYHPQTISCNIAHFGQVECITSIYGYTKYHPCTKSIIEVVDTPPTLIPVIKYGVWKPYSTDISGLHAISHIISKIIGTVISQKITVPCPNNSLPLLLMLHDDQEVAQTLYEKFPMVFHAALERLTKCPCIDDSGCEKCILLSHCPAKLSKNLALNHLQEISSFAKS